MTGFAHRQKGLTGVTQLFLLLLVALFIYLLVLIAPHYYENFMMSVSLKSFKKNYEQGEVLKHEIHRRIFDQFDIDGISVVTKENIKVRPNDRDFTVMVQYTVEKKVVGNIDIHMKFRNYIELRTP